MCWYLDDNGDNGDDYFIELVVKCSFSAQILFWIYIHLPNSEEILEFSLLYL